MKQDLNMKPSLLAIAFAFFLIENYIAHATISFQKYCGTSEQPDILPGKGDQTSGSLVLSTQLINGSWYESNLNCSVTFKVESGYRLFVAFYNISLRNSSLDNLTVSYENEKLKAVIAGQQVCSDENCETLKFDSGDFGNMTLEFISANASVPSNVTGFFAQYTVYDLVNPTNGACRENTQFLCDNGHCILGSLICDGHNNCGDRSDETKCKIPVSDTVWGIVVIVIAIISVFVMVPLFCCLAVYGTRSVVKSVTFSNPGATPLLPPGDHGEAFGLLTSSDAANSAWAGTSFERNSSISYGTAQNNGPSTSTDRRQFQSPSEAYEKPQEFRLNL